MKQVAMETNGTRIVIQKQKILGSYCLTVIYMVVVRICYYLGN